MLGLEPASGPAISLFKLNTQQVVFFVALAVFYAGLTAIVLKLQRNNGVRRNRFINFKTCPGRGNVLKNCPLAAWGSGFKFPLNFDKIRTKLSIFVLASLGSHN